MNREQIIRAWKDEDFRESLNDVERSMLPEHPSGVVSISDDELDNAAGAEDTNWIYILSFGCCGGLTSSAACGSTVWNCPTPPTYSYSCKMME
ncbi:MAG TPA: mersacidin/lichenicidin family type 2 lantibiotic [Pyrinomonadaceae bacterium]|nr:mersacidin/lichenicidin family type 2 lantibiotic [Pyrinomonadaceae bacterium]